MVQQLTRDPRITEQVDVPTRLTMTFEEFRDWYTEGRRGEWVDGEVIPFVAPKTIHQRLSIFLAWLLSVYVRDHGLGEVLPGPEMRLRDGGSYREPDIAFVATAHAGRISADGIDGPADLVIEIVSDDSVRRDRKHKFDEYEAAGVREYWVVDPRPNRRFVLAYHLNDEGFYDLIPSIAVSRIRSTILPGLWIDSSWLWQEPLPDPRAKLAEITSAGE